jgi:hypothetical protein
VDAEVAVKGWCVEGLREAEMFWIWVRLFWGGSSVSTCNFCKGRSCVSMGVMRSGAGKGKRIE